MVGHRVAKRLLAEQKRQNGSSLIDFADSCDETSAECVVEVTAILALALEGNSFERMTHFCKTA